MAQIVTQCSSCTLLRLALLAPIFWPWAPATAAGQSVMCHLPSPVYHSCRLLTWHTLEPLKANVEPLSIQSFPPFFRVSSTGSSCNKLQNLPPCGSQLFLLPGIPWSSVFTQILLMHGSSRLCTTNVSWEKMQTVWPQSLM